MTEKPTADAVAAMAAVVGAPITADVATCIAGSIGPAFDGFAPVTEGLPFDIEPAGFVVVQLAGERK